MEFPSLSWLASELDAALQGIRQVMADVVAGLQASSALISEPLAAKLYWGVSAPLNFTGNWRLKRRNLVLG